MIKDLLYTFLKIHMSILINSDFMYLSIKIAVQKVHCNLVMIMISYPLIIGFLTLHFLKDVI